MMIIRSSDDDCVRPKGRWDVRADHSNKQISLIQPYQI